MDKLIGKYLYLMLGVLAFSMVIFINTPSLKVEFEVPELLSLNENLHQKEQLADRWIDSLQEAARVNKLASFVNLNSQKIDLLFKYHGLVLFVYNNGKLVYWTNNAITIPPDTLWFKARAQKLGNAYAEVKYETVANNHFVACIVIKKQYAYENEFLKNHFHQSFKIDKNYEIAKGHVTSHSIRSADNEVLFSLLPEKSANKSFTSWFSLLLIILGLSALLVFFHKQFRQIRLKIWQFIALLGFGFGMYGLLLKFGLPVSMQDIQLFSPQYFAASYWLPSLGHLSIFTLLVVYFAFLFYAKLSLPVVTSLKWYRTTLFWAVPAVIMIYSVTASYVFKHLIFDSTFQFEAYELLNLSWYSVLAYLILLVWFLGLILLIEKMVQVTANYLTLNKIYIIFAIVGVITIVFSVFIFAKVDFVSLLFVFTIYVIWCAFRLKRKAKFVNVVVLMAMFSVYTTYYIRVQSFEKRIDQGKIMAISLAREQDPVAEIVLGEFMVELKRDTTVNNLLQSNWLDYNKLYDYIDKRYFSSYLKRYSFQLTLCNTVDSVWVDSEQQQYHCHSFFRKLIRDSGVETSVDGLYLMRNNTGKVNYFLPVLFKFYNRRYNITLFFELLAKPNYEVLGYPELLLEKPVSAYSQQQIKYYAKYSGSRLLTYNGDFPYAFDRQVYGNLNQEFGFYQSDDFDHIIYNTKTDDSVIVSFPSVHWFNVVISFTYTFLFFLFITFIVLVIGNRYFHVVGMQLTIKNKIVLSMILILFISLILVGGGTVLYTSLQFERDQMRGLSDKTQSVLVEIDQQLGLVSNIEQVSSEQLDNLLIKLSNVFFTDINMYSLDGSLVGTSRKEIFERKLSGKKMNAIAYRELLLNKRARLVQKENIGTLEYYSAYVPFINSENRLVAYLNLPYFTKEALLRQELLGVVVAVINVYAFLMLVSIAIAVYISNRLTNPLRQIQLRIKNMQIGQQNELIEYHGRDEIADLVNEYNRMSLALAENARLLAKSERESAWREMARQIAHEIKNPLTPMKLSVQMLNKAWDNSDTDFSERLKRVSQTLIEQIDSLSNIANAFSHFAQIPQSNSRKVDIMEPISNSVELFKGSSVVTIVWCPSVLPIFVKADNERLLQVFNNLIKNAIQAIPASRKGQIKIEATVNPTHVLITVADNGIGISPQQLNKIFVPNFTTKTSGTGLGLAIVKNIIEEFEGNIWFNTKQDKGTTFLISLPLFVD